jgi:hypothetical protein
MMITLKPLCILDIQYFLKLFLIYELLDLNIDFYFSLSGLL